VSEHRLNTRVVVVQQADEKLLAQIAGLWRSEKRTLGFFPEAALGDYAQRRGILGAVDGHGHLVGYLLLYRTKAGGMGVAHVVHLCVARAHRHRGIARQLVSALRDETSTCVGARVRCRRDFPANSLWPRLGFHALREGPGKTGQPITEWWIDYGHPDLATEAIEAKLRSRIVTAIDACVFFDITDEDSAGKIESHALLADWILDSIALCIAPELLNEINRCQDERKREQGREAFQRYTKLRASPDVLEATANSLKRHFPQNMSISDESDLRELAYAICGGACVFLTYDPRLLMLDEVLHDEAGLSVQRPAGFISRLDEFEREREYQPARFRGSSLENRLAKADELEQLVERFQQPALGERRASLRELLASLLSMPDRAAVRVLLLNGEPAFLLSARVRDHSCLVAEALRIGHSPLDRTLGNLLVSELVRLAVSRDLDLVSIDDPHISSSIRQALREFHFQKDNDAWHRAVVQGIKSKEAIKKLLNSRSEACPSLRGFHDRLIADLERCFSIGDWSMISQIEDAIWPAKVAGTSVPCYVVPIQPHWAAQLFDSRLAEGRLLPADPTLLLRSENVYYTAAPCRFIEVPSRILWYVSHHRRFHGSKAIRCASTLQDVTIGPAEDVYRRYRRLGVYDRRDVARIARANGEVTALVVGQAELLRTPIMWDEVQSIRYELEGRRDVFRRPTQIETPTYDTLFKRGWH